MQDTDPLFKLTKEEILYELLKKERGFYSSILEITKQENEKLLAHMPLSDIGPLLKQKKMLLSCISEVETAMGPLKRHWQGKVDRQDPISIQIKGELRSLDTILKEILQLDLVSQKSLEAHLHFLQEKEKVQQNPNHKV